MYHSEKSYYNRKRFPYCTSLNSVSSFALQVAALSLKKNVNTYYLKSDELHL